MGYLKSYVWPPASQHRLLQLAFFTRKVVVLCLIVYYFEHETKFQQSLTILQYVGIDRSSLLGVFGPNSSVKQVIMLLVVHVLDMVLLLTMQIVRDKEMPPLNLHVIKESGAKFLFWACTYLYVFCVLCWNWGKYKKICRYNQAMFHNLTIKNIEGAALLGVTRCLEWLQIVFEAFFIHLSS